jgi:transcriptional regulator
MYLPKTFEETDLGRVHAFIEAHAFGVLAVADPHGAVAIAHLPFLLDRRAGARGVLSVHVARANPIWRLAVGGARATVVFSGADGYVSPRWYERPREQVPTWNYMAVHAIGRLEAPMDRPSLVELLDELSRQHERGEVAPWRMADLDAPLREELLDAIVGIRLSIERVEAKFKLSQNRSPEDRERVAVALRARGGEDDHEMAAWMEAGGREDVR